MRIHADFSKTVIITPQVYQWVKSPGGEVNRMMLDRIGEEKARATSLVEFAAQSKFPPHQHPLGEEVLVLSGTFTEDDHLHYPAGWYMRNPHGSTHHVSSESGCRIFVKLMQMTEDESKPVRINTLDPKNWIMQDGRNLCLLFESAFEKTFIEQLGIDQALCESFECGGEILVISGELFANDERYPAGTWLRLAPKTQLQLKATSNGAKIYLKTNHLQHAIDLWGTQ